MNARLGQVLIREGMLSEDQLRIALREQSKSGEPIGKLLTSLGFISEITLRETLAENLGTQSIDLAHSTVDPAALKLIPCELAKRHHLLPLAFDATTQGLRLAISDSNNLVALDRIRALFATPIELELRIAGGQFKAG